MPKLIREAGPDGQLGTISKKGKVEVHSEGDFHMCYFFRRMSQRHAVLLKEKNLIFQSSKPNIGGSGSGNDISVPITIDDDPLTNPNQSDFFQRFENSQAANAPIPKRKKRKVDGEVQEANQNQNQGAEDNNNGWGEMNLGMNLGMGFNNTTSTSNNEGASTSTGEVIRKENQSGNDMNGLSGSGSGNGILVPDSDDEDDNPNQDVEMSKGKEKAKPIEDDIVVKKEIIDDDDDISFQGYSNPNPNPTNDFNGGGDPDQEYMQEETMNPISFEDGGLQEGYDEDEEDEKPKPRLNVSYSGFRILGKSLVLVIEPSTRTKTSSANVHLFNPVVPTEVRQLNLTPVIDPSTPGSRRRSSRSQSRFSSIQPPGGREKSETPLFRGITPSSEVDEDEFGSVPPASPRRRDRSESATTGGKGKGKRNLPPVPMFNDDVNTDRGGNRVENGDGVQEDEDEVDELDEESRADLGGFNFANQLLDGEESWLGGSEENGGRGD